MDHTEGEKGATNGGDRPAMNRPADKSQARIEAIGDQLRAKISSKFQTSTFLVGFGFTVLEAVMNSIENGLGMRETKSATREPSRPCNPHFYAIFTQVHNTL